MSEVETSGPVTPPSQSKTASCLREAREKLGFSQKEVADKLYLTTTFIRNIDDGEFDQLPKPAFVRGYLRSYARTVGLSGDEIVALFEEEQSTIDPTPEIKGVTEEKVGTASITGPVLQSGLIGLIALALVVALIWWLVSDDDEPPPRVTGSQVTAPQAPDAVEETVEDIVAESAMPAEALGVAIEDPATQPDQDGRAPSDPQADSTAAGRVATGESAAPVNSNAAASAAVDVSTGNTASVEPTADGTDEVPVRLERSSDGIRSFVTVDAGGFEQLELSFTDECWVEVEDSENGLIYNDLNRANDVLTIYGSAPMRVLLGKATVVEMIYNGRPFDLDPYVGGDRTAKITLGDS